MKNFLISVFLFFAIFIIACRKDGDSAKENIAVSLLLPTDYDGICEEYDENDDDNDYTYCINKDDEIIISVYGKNSWEKEYVFVEDKVFRASSNLLYDHFDTSLNTPKKYQFIRLFVKVLNANKKLKLTGGIDSLYSKNPKIFLAPAGDFARIVTDRRNTDKTSLKSYFTDGGSKGSTAVALKDGNIYMAGGYDLEEEKTVQKAALFDMNTTEKKEIRNLPFPTYDHIAALLDDGTETGKVIIGLGRNEDDEPNGSLVIYDPKSDLYDRIYFSDSAMTKAKALTINGDVYIVGGCSASKAETGVYKISAKTGSIVSELFATLKQGRCNHALADVSTANEARILVIGGSTDAREGRETPVTGENFAELVTAGSSRSVTVTDRNGDDNAELKKTGLISPAAVTLVMDDKDKSETVVSVIGGYHRDNEESWSTNPYIFTFSWKDENTLIYDKNTTTFECARPSAAALGSGDKSLVKYVAVNCGIEEIDRRNPTSQIIFVIQVKRTPDSNLGTEIFSSSVKESLMEYNRDPESDADIVDGPIAVNGIGQVFMLGGKYVYLVGSYEVPGTVSSQASATLPPKPIIHVTFKSAITKPMSYRNIYDKVEMDLANTCVSDPDAPDRCLENWQERYYIKYKWEMTESPTPLLDQSRLLLTESDSSAGQWLTDDGKRDNPKRAAFTGLVPTPRRYPGETNPTYDAAKCSSECGDEPVYDPQNPDNFLFLKISDHLICRQKYCEETKTKYYKINIQAETVDKETDLISDTADITVIPKIIPQARVVAQLSYKQGYRTKAEAESKEGVWVDLDLHLIKKESLEAPQYGFTSFEGLLGTSSRPEELDTCLVTDVNCQQYWRHDDCSFSDQGNDYRDYVKEGRTIQWHASLDIDNTWGGNNYETPETIGLGPIADYDGDSRPDVDIIDDQYLVVVGYVNCMSNYSDGAGDRCDPAYTGEESAYEVDARVEIWVDGDEAPRNAGDDRPADNYASTTKDFKIKVNEWKAIAVIKWDNSLASPKSNPTYPGNAIVTDRRMDDLGIAIDPVNHPVCTYDNSDAVLIPIWDAETYRTHITTPNDEYIAIGYCD